MGNIQEIVISKEANVTADFLERKYNIKLITVDNRVVLRILQYKFSNFSNLGVYIFVVSASTGNYKAQLFLSVCIWTRRVSCAISGVDVTKVYRG